MKGYHLVSSILHRTLRMQMAREPECGLRISKCMRVDVCLRLNRYEDDANSQSKAESKWPNLFGLLPTFGI